mgnify:CR=1 FL=1
MESLGTILLTIVIIVVAIVILWLIMWKLYQRSTTELAFVRTGFLGQKVVINGGAFVIPVLHEVTRVNMNTIRLEVQRQQAQSIMTKDRLRIDVTAAFYVRVKPTRDMVATAAQSLGRRSLSQDGMAELLEGKFIAALRARAATMTLEELHERRGQFIEEVGEAVAATLASNGLELESASVTSLEQTNREFFNPTNAFDAEGLTLLTEQIEARRRRRNEIEQDSTVAIETKNLESERRRLDIQRDEEYARLQQQREIALRRAEQRAEVTAVEEDKRQAAAQAEIAARRAIEQAQIASDKALEDERIRAKQANREVEIASQRELDKADIERRREIEIAEQLREIAIAEQSMARSKAQAEAEAARAESIKAEEAVLTAREVERAERAKRIDLINALGAAERDGKTRVATAEAEGAAAKHRAQTTRMVAEAEAAAEKLRAEAFEIRAGIEAEATRKANEADNALSAEARTLRLRLALVERMEAIIRESVKPLEKIDGVKILHVDGLAGGNAGLGGDARGGFGGGQEGWPDQLINATLRHRGQAPLVDYMLGELGISEASADGLSEALTRLARPEAPPTASGGTPGKPPRKSRQD